MSRVLARAEELERAPEPRQLDDRQPATRARGRSAGRRRAAARTRAPRSRSAAGGRHAVVPLAEQRRRRRSCRSSRPASRPPTLVETSTGWSSAIQRAHEPRREHEQAGDARDAVRRSAGQREHRAARAAASASLRARAPRPPIATPSSAARPRRRPLAQPQRGQQRRARSPARRPTRERSEPSVAIEHGVDGGDRGGEQRRPPARPRGARAAPQTTTVPVPASTPTSWCHAHERPPSSDTPASSNGYSGGLSAVGRSSPVSRRGTAGRSRARRRARWPAGGTRARRRAAARP